MSNDDDEWITGQDAARILGLSERTALRYASGASPRLRVRKYTGSKKYFFHRGDVEALAADLQPARRVPEVPRPPRQEMVPAGELLAYLRQRDEQLADAQRQLQAAALELGQARAELQRRALVDEQLANVSAERDEVRRRIARLQMERIILAAVVIVLILALIGVVILILT